MCNGTFEAESTAGVGGGRVMLNSCGKELHWRRVLCSSAIDEEPLEAPVSSPFPVSSPDLGTSY